MSLPPKQRGGPQSMAPLARLKQCTPEEREWAFALRNTQSPAGKTYTNSECRGEIRERLGISLGTDGAYSDFCSWQFRQRQWDMLGDIQELDEQTLRDRYPTLDRDKIREAVIKRQYAVAEMLGDPAFTLKVIKADQAESSGRTKAQLDQAKLDLARQAEARQSEALKFDRQKFEFDAAKACLSHLSELKTIAGNSKLSTPQKIDAIRLRLFGELPEPALSPSKGTSSQGGPLT